MLQEQAVKAKEADTPLHARPGSACFACGKDNPQGLRIRFHRTGNGDMAAVWTPETVWEGFNGIIHGGVISTVLDEAMSKAMAAAGVEALTAELRVRFRRHVVAGQAMRLRGWIISQNRRLARAEATLTGDGEAEYAHAWATFLTLKDRTS